MFGIFSDDERFLTQYQEYFGNELSDTEKKNVLRLKLHTENYLIGEFGVDVKSLEITQQMCFINSFFEGMKLIQEGSPLFGRKFGIVKESLGNWEVGYSALYADKVNEELHSFFENAIERCSIKIKKAKKVMLIGR